MDPVLSILLIGLLVIVAFVVARFLLHLASRVVVFIITVIVALGILYILINLVF